MRFLFFCLLFVLLGKGLVSFAQTDNNIDSIYRVVQLQKKPLNKLIKYNKLIHYCWYNERYKRAIKYGNEALILNSKLKNDSIQYLIDNNIGVAYDYIGNYSKSLFHYFRALALAEKHKDLYSEAEILSNIGLIYYNQKQNNQALKYHQKSLAIRLKTKNIRGQAISYNNIAMVYANINKYHESIRYYQKTITIDSTINDSIGMADDYNNIAQSYLLLKQFAKAEFYLLKADYFRQKLKFDYGLAQSKLNLGALYTKQGKFKDAESLLLESIALSKKINLVSTLKLGYEFLSEVYRKTNKFDKAFYYLDTLNELERTINSEDNIRKQTEFELNYQFNKKEEKQRLQRIQENLVNQKKQEQAKLVSWVIAIIGFIVLIFSYFLFRRWKEAKKQKSIIEEKSQLVAQKNSEILDSITYAKRIQNAILPSDELLSSTFSNHFVLYKPKDIVAGDFYWLEKLDQYLIFAVADCTGHGVPGAMMSVVCNNALNRSVKEFGLRNPGEILDQTRQIIVEELSKNNQDVADGMDISLCAWNQQSGTFQWAGANNPLWIIRKDSTEVEEIKPNKQPIGKYSINTPFTSHTINITEGDTIYLISDGYADQFGGENGKKFKASNFKNLLLSIQDKSMKEQLQIINQAFDKWKGVTEQIDDVCILGIRF